ncbi:MAG: Flp family type IVb pilin [Sphingomicrobium sp.]
MRTFRACERGATAIEYGLIAALIVVALIGGLKTLGGGNNGMWGRIGNSISSVM